MMMSFDSMYQWHMGMEKETKIRLGGQPEVAEILNSITVTS